MESQFQGSKQLQYIEHHRAQRYMTTVYKFLIDQEVLGRNTGGNLNMKNCQKVENFPSQSSYLHQ